MSRLTKWDEVRQCYVIDPDSTQNHIQRLGELEDRDEVKVMIQVYGEWKCPSCDVSRTIPETMVDDPQFRFCPACGQRLREG